MSADARPTSSDWDAARYDRVADPQTAWGAVVLDRLPLRGDERVLDAGCGTGRVTELLAARLPDGHVVALDASGEMLDAARGRLAPLGDRVTFVRADLVEPLPAAVGRVDAILSTATFHWVLDHDALFRNLGAILRPGGRLVAQCGGSGNVASLEAVIDALGLFPRGRYTFATPQETAARLRAAGFTDIETWLSAEPTTFAPGEPFEAFLETVCLREVLSRVEVAERAAIVREVAARLPGPGLDYVRLNIVATKG